MKVLRCIFGLFSLSAVAGAVALSGFEHIADVLCLSGVVPVCGLLFLGIECQRHRWETTPNSVASATVVPSGTALSLRSGP